MSETRHWFGAPDGVWANRREFLGRAGGGFGLVALAGLLAQEGCLTGSAGAQVVSGADPLAPRAPHFAARAKAVIWLFMNGGQSQVDTWDPKPELEKRDGQELPGFDPKTGFFADQVGGLMKSPFRFAQHGESGTWVSEIFPHLARQVDRLAFMHGCYTETNNHAPALFQINTGFSRLGFPCVGSWVTYGLGSETRDLPAFVVMYDTLGRGLPKGHALNWSAGFLPSVFQGTGLAAQGAPIANLERASGLTETLQRRQLDLLKAWNREHLEAHAGDAALAARIESFELAYRMQMAAPDALDLGKESAATRALYGVEDAKCGHFARQCLLARRLVERGVRFVQIYSGGMENERSWDGHTNIESNHRGFARETDQPIAGLLVDLAARGLLDETLVICCGEFGRLPICQKGSTGRDHNPHAFTTWFAGAGVKGGYHHGATDEFGFKAVEGRVSVNDLHATILHLLGLEHTRLTYRYNGRDFRLTDVAGRVVEEVIG
jgi:hypothetical protein